jgi:hypothetical protein
MIPTKIDDKEKYIAEILSYGSKIAKADIIASLIYYEKMFLLEKIREKWGDDYYYSVVELV